LQPPTRLPSNIVCTILLDQRAQASDTLEPEDLAGRLTALKTRAQQLRAHRDELASQLAAVPAVPAPATLRQVAGHINDIIASGSHSQRKALVEALIAEIRITGPGGLIPVFRIPQPAAIASGSQADGTATDAMPRATSPWTGVRAMANLVGRTYQHANREVLIEGDLLPMRLHRSRPGGCREAAGRQDCRT